MSPMMTSILSLEEAASVCRILDCIIAGRACPHIHVMHMRAVQALIFMA